MTNTIKKIESLSFNAKLKEITEKGIKWNITIGGFKTEYTVGLGHYFNVYGFGAMTCNRNAAHYLINGGHIIQSDNEIFIKPSKFGGFTVNDLKLTDKVNVIDSHKLEFITPSILDVLYSLNSDASLCLDYSLDDFASELMPDAKISDCIKSYKSCEDALKFIASTGFITSELHEYFDGLGY